MRSARFVPYSAAEMADALPVFCITLRMSPAADLEHDFFMGILRGLICVLAII